MRPIIRPNTPALSRPTTQSRVTHAQHLKQEWLKLERTLPTQGAPEPEVLWRGLRLMYNTATQYPDYIAKLNTYCKKWEWGLSGHPRLRAYQAVGLALEAKQSIWPLEKFTKIQESLSLLDWSVSIEPQDVETRYLRLTIVANLPVLFGRSAQALSDLEVVLGLLESQQATLNKELQTIIWYFFQTLPPLPSDSQRLVQRAKSLSTLALA
jgi:hypothetical protein